MFEPRLPISIYVSAFIVTYTFNCIYTVLFVLALAKVDSSATDRAHLPMLCGSLVAAAHCTSEYRYALLHQLIDLSGSDDCIASSSSR